MVRFALAKKPVGRSETERGQILVLASIALVAMSVMMVTTYTLSRSVSERIQLQNAADATAYSLATLEARTFNFIAFSNRAQVANYAQMMESQAILSGMLFLQSSLSWFDKYPGTVAELLTGVDITPTVQTIERIVTALIAFNGTYQMAENAKNYAFFATALSLVSVTGQQLALGAQHVSEASDPDARQTDFSRALNVLNAASFAAAIDWPAALPIGTQARERAERVMAELANGARVGSSLGLRDIMLQRRPSAWIEAALAGVLGDDGEPLAEGVMAQILDTIFSSGLYVGTTKMVDAPSGEADVDDTGRDDNERGFLARGRAMVSKDQVSLLPSDVVSIRASSKKGSVCRFLTEQGTDCSEQRSLRWGGRIPVVPGGIAPFFKFNARFSGLSLHQSQNQPDVWIFLNKPSRSFAQQGGPRVLEGLQTPRLGEGAELSNPGEGALRQESDIALEMGAKDENRFLLPEGMNVLSRAQVYYHRPGAWREPPNFFNPYWAARLAPKGDAITGLAERLGAGGGLGADLAALFADNVWMH